ncbi:IS256 family transposase [Paenibacillus sp. NPDC055715]
MDSSRTIHTEYGDLCLSIPRDRNGEFKQQTVAPYKRSNDTLESFVIHMFQKGVAMTEISDLLEKMYGHLHATDGVEHDQGDGGACGCLCEAHASSGCLQDVKARGAEDILRFISDGLTGMESAIEQVYPQAKYQSCLVHVARNIAHKVRVSDRASICEDFKTVYRAEDEAAGRAALETFCDKWKSSYPKVVKSLRDNPNLFTFYSFPKPIWRSIYSSNLIESLNKQIKKYTQRKEQFPHEEALEKFLVSQFESYNQRFATRCHIGFDQARAELQAMFTTTDQYHLLRERLCSRTQTS